MASKKMPSWLINKKDKAADKKAGRKQNSAADKRIDKKKGLKS